VLVAGAAFNWGWLVAIGIAPLLIAVLPCVAMCALGLCMNKMGRSSSQDAKPAQPDVPAPSEPPVLSRPVAAGAITANPVAPVRQLADASAAQSETGERA
jgi:hypothetical protein